MAITKRPEAEVTDAENRQAQIDNFGIGCAILEQAVDAMFAAGMKSVPSHHRAQHRNGCGR